MMINDFMEYISTQCRSFLYLKLLEAFYDENFRNMLMLLSHYMQI